MTERDDAFAAALEGALKAPSEAPMVGGGLVLSVNITLPSGDSVSVTRVVERPHTVAQTYKMLDKMSRGVGRSLGWPEPPLPVGVPTIISAPQDLLDRIAQEAVITPAGAGVLLAPEGITVTDFSDRIDSTEGGTP